MLYTSRLEINESALEHNIKFIKNFLHKDVLYSSVVKGNAYGHGIEVFVPLAEKNGVRHFSVFSADEANKVLKVSTHHSAILIMGMLDFFQIEWAIEHGIEFFVFNRKRLEMALEISKKLQKPALVHIEMETGMNRTGFDPKDFPKIVDLLQNNPEYLKFNGLCTHFAGAESISNHFRIEKQIKVYNNFVKKFQQKNLIPKYRHTACSAATLRYPKTQLDLARIGILQYGFFPNREMLIDYVSKTKEIKDPLQRVISWKSSVMDIKEVSTGDFVGYGTSYLANASMKIAVIPVGYSHGFSRSLSNQGRVIINGKIVNVIGIVNMNMVSVDVTNLEQVNIGDEVVLIGKQGASEISVSSFSEYSDQVNYELLTRLPVDLPRIITQ